jgi:hypothetical protein
MLTSLPHSINTIEQAKEFLLALYNNNEVFHPEDDAHDIAWQTCNMPTQSECDQLNKLMEDIYNLNKTKKLEVFDPCEYILHLDPNYIMD